MILYLSGPMAGKPFFNAAAFAEASTTLRELGHQVFSPPEIGPVNVWKCPTGSKDESARYGFDLSEALILDLCWIARRAEAVVLLPGWGISKGALTETALALALGLKFYLYDKNFSDKLCPFTPALAANET